LALASSKTTSSWSGLSHGGRRGDTSPLGPCHAAERGSARTRPAALGQRSSRAPRPGCGAAGLRERAASALSTAALGDVGQPKPSSEMSRENTFLRV